MHSWEKRKMEWKRYWDTWIWKKKWEDELMIQFCEWNHFTVGNLWFDKKNRKKVIRYGWGERRTKLVTDCMLVERDKQGTDGYEGGE